MRVNCCKHMCDVRSAITMKSNGGDISKSAATTTIPAAMGPTTMSSSKSEEQPPVVEVSLLKRTFTLPRNPLTCISKCKSKAQQHQAADNGGGASPDAAVNNSMLADMPQRAATLSRAHLHNNNNPMQNNRDLPTANDDVVTRANKKVFRRPSFRKFINRIAQHIGGVQLPHTDNRVPQVGLQTWADDATPGVTGLLNHGNTCFINAVLQCIAHTDVLAEYFVLDKYKIDLSRRNKLNSKKHGTKGEVTEQLAIVLKALWACQYTPEFSTTFKQVVERYGVQYKGTQQHDALEFLIWLLDKVHEDLNMAPKKKYRSIKTLGRPDEVIAAETLENYRRRDNSFIHSVFQAQYRSSLSCPRCLTQSNTFDPFQCISVQLPQLYRHSIYVTVLYTSQQPREVKIGVSLPSGAAVFELRDLLESDTSIARSDMLLTEIGEYGFLRTFTDAQSANSILEADPVYCIEVPQLKDMDEETQSAYVLLSWINVVEQKGNTDEINFKRFGSPYTMQVNRETSYADLQKLMLKEMAPILHDDILTSSQPAGIFKMRVSDPAYNFNEPSTYLEPSLEHPLFMEAIDQALALCSEDGGPVHVKLVLEWTQADKLAVIADDTEVIEEHSSVKQLKTQALQGGAPLTLEECLRHYTKAETLDDAWRCPQCQKYQPVIKTLDMWSLPEILVVHFKRFRQQTVKGRTSSTKLTTMVDFPVFAFDMTPHVANKQNANFGQLQQQHPPDQSSQVILNGVNWSPWKRARKQSTINDNTYDLYAVCYHHGSDLETGHYTAACKNPYDNKWYLYDDAKVTNLSAESTDVATELVNNSAYILFYQKRTSSYIGSNTNSSAASTSSVGSMGDHWVSRMPKFIPPKLVKDKKTTSTNNVAAVKSTINNTAPPTISRQTSAPLIGAPTATKTSADSIAAVVSSSSIELELNASEKTNEVDKNEDDIRFLDEVKLRNSQNSIRKDESKDSSVTYITDSYCEDQEHVPATSSQNLRITRVCIEAGN